MPRAGIVNMLNSSGNVMLEDGDLEIEDENMKIHAVKHIPKSDEEMLDRIMKENSMAKSSSVRRVAKDARAKLAMKKAQIFARDMKTQDAEDVSEVETVVPSNQLFSVDINLDNLKEHLSQIRTHMRSQDEYLAKLQA